MKIATSAGNNQSGNIQITLAIVIEIILSCLGSYFSNYTIVYCLTQSRIELFVQIMTRTPPSTGQPHLAVVILSLFHRYINVFCSRELFSISPRIVALWYTIGFGTYRAAWYDRSYTPRASKLCTSILPVFKFSWE